MRIGIIAVFCFSVQVIFGQSVEKPKLIVGIVVDQMRAEYLYRFQDNYSEGGFKRLMREGFNVKNMHYNYVPTATGPGHASIFSGTTPQNHGVVANSWYERSTGKLVNCVEDSNAKPIDMPPIPSEFSSKYARSPIRHGANTMADELKLFSNGRSKVIGLSIKDRGAIFPVGHMADYAFWYNRENGNFITTDYYADALPDWLVEFNSIKKADSLLNLTWNPLLPESKYLSSDDNKFEMIWKGREQSTFPYDLKTLRKYNGNFDFLTQTPYANTLLAQFAKTTIVEEKLGQGSDIDFLSISFSSTDYVGHAFGIRSKELEDTYIRLDREIASLLDFLDTQLGKNEYLVFLTADHAASEHPEVLKSSKLRGSYIQLDSIKNSIDVALGKKFGVKDYVAYIDKTQIYLNNIDMNKSVILKECVSILKSIDGISEVYVPELHSSRNLEIDPFFRKSYNSKNSGDILLHFEHGWMPFRTFGTTHGTAYNDDTHVPMLWYGWQVLGGESSEYHEINQIVPTLSFLLDVPLPDTSSKKPIIELFD